MKNIDEQVRMAVENRHPFIGCNTVVIQDEYGFRVALHGNTIAIGKYDSDGKYEVEHATFAGFPTNLTSRRLKALGVDTKALRRKEGY